MSSEHNRTEGGVTLAACDNTGKGAESEVERSGVESTLYTVACAQTATTKSVGPRQAHGEDEMVTVPSSGEDFMGSNLQMVQTATNLYDVQNVDVAKGITDTQDHHESGQPSLLLPELEQVALSTPMLTATTEEGMTHSLGDSTIMIYDADSRDASEVAIPAVAKQQLGTGGGAILIEKPTCAFLSRESESGCDETVECCKEAAKECVLAAELVADPAANAGNADSVEDKATETLPMLGTGEGELPVDDDHQLAIFHGAIFAAEKSEHRDAAVVSLAESLAENECLASKCPCDVTEFSAETAAAPGDVGPQITLEGTYMAPEGSDMNEKAAPLPQEIQLLRMEIGATPQPLPVPAVLLAEGDQLALQQYAVQLHPPAIDAIAPAPVSGIIASEANDVVDSAPANIEIEAPSMDAPPIRIRTSLEVLELFSGSNSADKTVTDDLPISEEESSMTDAYAAQNSEEPKAQAPAIVVPPNVDQVPEAGGKRCGPESCMDVDDQVKAVEAQFKDKMTARGSFTSSKRIKLGFAGVQTASASASKIDATPTSVFPLGHISSIISECFFQGKPLQALKMFRAMRKSGIVPDRAQWELFQQALHSGSSFAQEYYESFATDMIEMIQGSWPVTFCASMPSHLPLETAMAAVKGHCYLVASNLFSALFAESREKGVPLPVAICSNEVFEAYLLCCLQLKEPPMKFDDLVTIKLVPSAAASNLWSMAVSAYALANESKASMDVIEYAEALVNSSTSPSLATVNITMEAETDALSCAICTCLFSVLHRRMDALAERKQLTIQVCNKTLEKVLLRGGGRLDMAAWEGVLRTIINLGVEPNIQTHMTTLRAAVMARDAECARTAMNRLHCENAEACAELENAVWMLEERVRQKTLNQVEGRMQIVDSEDEVNISKLKGRDPDEYLQFCCSAIRLCKVDMALDAWMLLIERCGITNANESVEVIFCAFCDANLISAAMRCAESLQILLVGKEAPTIGLSHDALTSALRQCVIAPRESIGTWRRGSDFQEKKQRVTLIEQVLDLARNASLCSQVLYTNATQALEAIAADDSQSTIPSAANVQVTDFLMTCHERMQADGIVPSIEAYNIIVTAAGFSLLDPHRVRELIAEMRDKAGLLHPSVIARQALVGALATVDPVAAMEELDKMKSEGVSASERCVRCVVGGLIEHGEPGKAQDLARRQGCSGEEITMALLKGFVACDELESALVLFQGFHTCTAQVPSKFKDFVQALNGTDLNDE